MTQPEFPANEVERLLRLRKLDLLDTAPEAVLDGFTRVAARLTGMPMALISLVDAERQWFKSAVGAPQGGETPRAVSFCGHAILQPGVFEVEDARGDPRFQANPLVQGEPHVVHYAGVPLVMPQGEAIGTLCVQSSQPGRLTEAQRELLTDLADSVVQVLLLREKDLDRDRQQRMAEAVQLTELAPVGMFSTDAGGAVLHGNAQWVEMLGAKSLSELLATDWDARIHPEDLPGLQAGWMDAVARRAPYSGMYRCRPLGREDSRWIRFRVHPVDNQVAPVAFVGVSMDVTETVRLEQELNRKNRLLESIIEHLPCGLSVFDPGLRLVLSNTPARRLMGLPNELFQGDTTFQSLAHYLAERGVYGKQEEAADLVAARMSSIAARAPQCIERELPDGSVVEIRGTFMPDGSLISTYASVTEARRAELALQVSQGRLARAIEASGLGLWEYDLEAGDVYLSQGWTRLLGLPSEARRVPAEQALRLLPMHELSRITAARSQLRAGEIDRLSIEHQMTNAAGEPLWILTEAQVNERDAEGRARKVVGTCKDITDRRRADAELRSALQAAGQANRAKSDFLATMSHEIRTPLNGVIGLTQLLRSADLEPMESDSVAMIDSCAKSLLSLVDNILDFSKIEAGRLTLEEVPTDLGQLVEEVGDVFLVRAGEKGLRFELRQAAGLPRWIKADPGRLRQVLLNLLGNALKFTAAGGFSLHVTLESTDAGPMLNFAVTDTGSGISPADQARLFHRFEQVADASGHRQSGTGLGLAISRQLAQLMGGEVTLSSRLGHGATFTLRVPLREAAAPRMTVNPTTPSARTNVRILLAEDNEVNQLVAQRLLASLGYADVTIVGDGMQAVQAFEQGTYDLVLMDCQMPELDGWSATRQLRLMGVTVPVLAFTASATLGDRDRCLEAGMDDYLTKPIEKAVLADKVQRWLADGGASRAPAPAAAPPQDAVFDESVVERFFLGNTELFQQGSELFVRQTRQSLAELAADLPRVDAEQLRRVMHRVRGSAATLGANQLSKLCRQLEEAAPDAAKDVDGLAAVAAAFDAFIDKLEAFAHA